MTKIDKLFEQVNQTRNLLAQLEASLEAERLRLLKQVQMTRKGDTVTLVFNGRVIKAKKNPRWNRYRVWEHQTRRVLINEALGGIHDIRFAIACGKI